MTQKPRMATFIQGFLGETLVMIDLLRQGYAVYQVPNGLPYDLVVDLNGKLLRIQVKSTSKIVRPEGLEIYRFSNSSAAKVTDVDILALVAIDTNIVAYLPGKNIAKQVITLRPPGTPEDTRRRSEFNIDELPFSKALERISN